MATDNKTSALIDTLIPNYLRDEAPKFVAFFKAYYEFLEQNGKLTERSKNLRNYQDVDQTLDEFLDYFKREVMPSIPNSILADKRLVTKRIRDLYLAKGTENAHKLLFRLLYDEEIEFYYPGNDILRASDGRWVQDNTIRISGPFTGDIASWSGKKVLGQTSGATAFVLRVLKTRESGITVYELYLTSIFGQFLDNESVASTDNTLSGRILSSIGPLQAVNVTFGGAGHRSGDTISFTSSSGSGAEGTITSTNDTSVAFRIVDGGTGYTIDTPLITFGGTGSGANVQITALSNTVNTAVYDDTIGDLRDTRIDANTYITSNSGTITANLAIANSSSVLSAALGKANVETGTISEITFTRGSGYTFLPRVRAHVDDTLLYTYYPDGNVPANAKGKDAVIVANNVAGSIVSVSVNSFGTGYNRNDIVTITNDRVNTENARGTPTVSGVINYPGKYIDTKGFLSWNNRLQDNYYYQEFSYVIKSEQFLKAYKEIVDDTVHPIGTKLFGETKIHSDINIDATISNEPALVIPNETQIDIPVTIESTLNLTPIQPDSIESTAVVPSDLVVLYSISTNSVESTTIVSDDAVMVAAIDTLSIISTEQFSTDSVINFEFDLNSITSTALISTDNTFEITIDPQSFVSYTTDPIPISEAVIGELELIEITVYSANTLNDTITIERVPNPVLIQS